MSEEIRGSITYEDYYIDRLSISELMEKYNTSVGKIRMELKRLGYNELSRKPKKEDLYEMYVNQQMDRDDIANYYRLSRGRINYYLKEFGIKKEIMMEEKYKISIIQEDIILGSVLGDGCLIESESPNNNNTYLGISHAENQLNYLRLKFSYLSNLCNMDDVLERNIKKEHGSYNKQKLFWFYTKYIPQLYKYKNLSVLEAVELLNINSFLVWLLDDGYKDTNGRWEIGLSRVSEETVSEVVEVLRRKFNVEGKVKWNNKSDNSVGGLRFNLEESNKVEKLIRGSDFYKDLNDVGFYKLIQ